MLKDPNAHKVKSGTQHLVGKLAEASAIRAKQADVIAAEIAASRHPYISRDVFNGKSVVELAALQFSLLYHPSPEPDYLRGSQQRRTGAVSYALFLCPAAGGAGVSAGRHSCPARMVSFLACLSVRYPAGCHHPRDRPHGLQKMAGLPRLCGGGDCGQRKGACHFTGQPGSCHFRAALLREQAVAAAQRL